MRLQIYNGKKANASFVTFKWCKNCEAKKNRCNLLSSNTKKIAKHSSLFRHFFIFKRWFGTKIDNVGFFNHKGTKKNPFKSAFPEGISYIRVLKSSVFCLPSFSTTNVISNFASPYFRNRKSPVVNKKKPSSL